MRVGKSAGDCIKASERVAPNSAMIFAPVDDDQPKTNVTQRSWLDQDRQDKETPTQNLNNKNEKNNHHN